MGPFMVGIGAFISRDDGLSGPGEDRSEPPERRTVLEGFSWRPMVVYSRVPEGIVKLTKGSSIDPQDIALQPVSNPPC